MQKPGGSQQGLEGRAPRGQRAQTTLRGIPVRRVLLIPNLESTSLWHWGHSGFIGAAGSWGVRGVLGLSLAVLLQQSCRGVRGVIFLLEQRKSAVWLRELFPRLSSLPGMLESSWRLQL